MKKTKLIALKASGMILVRSKNIKSGTNKRTNSHSNHFVFDMYKRGKHFFVKPCEWGEGWYKVLDDNFPYIYHSDWLEFITETEKKNE